jgi:hypothetical protein
MNYQHASSLWDDSNASKFEFAVEIARGELSEIARLAEEKDRTPSLFYGYAKGGKLWLAAIERYPDIAEELRDQLEIGFWVATARRWLAGQMTLAESVGALKWLKDNRKKERVTVEKYRTRLDAKLGAVQDEQDWTDKLQTLRKFFIHTPFLNIGDSHARKIQRAAKLLEKRVEQAIAPSGGTSHNNGGDNA